MIHELEYLDLNYYSGNVEALCSCFDGNPSSQFSGKSVDEVMGLFQEHLAEVNA